MALNTIEVLTFLLILAGAIVTAQILMLLLPLVSVRKISDEQKRKGFECFYARFRFPARKKAVMCFSDDRINFYQVSALGRCTNAPFISMLKSEIGDVQKISSRKVYRQPFKGSDPRFRPPKEDIKFSCSGKLYAITFFGKGEKLDDLLGNAKTAAD